MKVAVLDTGVQTNTPGSGREPRPDERFDFLGNDADAERRSGAGHGPRDRDFGLVAAVDNTIGVIGTAPQAKVIMYRVRLGGQRLSHWPVIAGLEEAVEDGADVISMSYGGIGFSQAEKEAIKAADDAGVVLVASAGNTPSPVAGARHYPSGYPEVISVGATDENDNLADFSTFGGRQDIVAPGVETPTTTLLGFGREALLRKNLPAPSKLLEPSPMEFSGVTSEAGITANFVFANLGQPADFAAVDCAGRIALISRGAISFQARSRTQPPMAASARSSTTTHPGTSTALLGVPQTLRAVSLSQEEGLALKAVLDAGGTINVTLTVLASDYDTLSGTSASAPYVAGVAALVLDANRSLDPDGVTRVLERTAENLGNPSRDNRFGWGIVDAQAAVACAAGSGSCGYLRLCDCRRAACGRPFVVQRV